VPSFNRWEEFNDYLLACSIADLDRRLEGNTQTVGELVMVERPLLRTLPPERLIAGPAMREIANEFSQSLGNQRKSLIKVSMEWEEPEPPSALHKPSDMTIVVSPCHPWEPIKVADEWTDPVHCLACGAPFAIS
jgi:hypothetical protein